MSVAGHDVNQLGTTSPTVLLISNDLASTKDFLETNSWHQARKPEVEPVSVSSALNGCAQELVTWSVYLKHTHQAVEGAS